jgi:TonB-dependent receptor
MHQIPLGIRLKPLTYAVSLALASLLANQAALAQQADPAQAQPAPQAQTQPGPQAQTNTAGVTNATVDAPIASVVVATRRSQQSGISRKKNAATAIDSIVAEDVGSLPDRNIGEAISRMAGVALDRGDFGEGVSVAVRGNGPDLTRVEIDGMAVQSAGGTDMNGGGSGRGTEFRQLSADLIKSVDVVKGSTADMVEGSLGGGIVITTRNGLDFKEPFVSVRIAGTENNLNKKWEPDTNVILSRKFLDDRLGILLNASKSTLALEQHQMQVATSAAAGYARSIDFDNSPNKTFTYNPSTLNMADPASTAAVGSYPYTAGTGSWLTASPLDILTKSAAAASKADCAAAFPQIAVADAALKNLSSTNRINAVNARSNELISCLNQWNDYTPSLVRNKIQREVDHRQNLDLRADFKVNRDLTVYAKGSYSKFAMDNNTSYLSLGGMNVNAATTFVDAAGKRSVAPGPNAAKYFLYPGNVSFLSGVPAVNGAVTNVNPSTVTVDASHHVTSFGITDGTASVDQIYTRAETINKAFQTGGVWTNGRLKAEFLAGDAKSTFTREDYRTTFTSNYGAATMTVQPNGLWAYTFPAGSKFDLNNPANYVNLTAPAAAAAVTGGGNAINSTPAYTANQQPLLTTAPQLSYTPQMRDSDEKTARLDLTYAAGENIPFITRIKGGFNFRDTSYNAYTGGGYTASSLPQVVVPAGFIRGSFIGCQDTAGSLGTGGNKCKYGINPSNTYASANSSTATLTPAQYQDLIAQSLSGNATSTAFFNGASGNFGSAVTNWPNIDVLKTFALSGIPNVNMDCLVSCKGSDGKVYQQPVTRMSERSQAVYLMGDFNFDRFPFTKRNLPFGLELEGNMGWRYIKTDVHGIGSMTFESITPNGGFDPLNPGAVGGINDVKVTTNTVVDATTHDFLPIFNLATWLVPDKLVVRYNRARTVARPPVSYLVPQGVCIFDARLGSDVSQRCTNTIGNPALQAQKNLNQNWSGEYYPNKDTMVSLAYFKQKGLIGPALAQNSTNGTLGLSLTDPVTGVSLGNLPFDFATYQNGVPTTRTGWEFNTKTAFTFLPSVLRYTGFDANYTKLASVTSTQNIVDLLSGVALPPLRESKFQYNWAVWYDDGRLSARVAIQGVASYFNNIAGSTSNYLNNYPNASGNTRPPSYNPGSPNFRDSTRYVDAKIGFKVSPNIELFLEGRNLGNAATSTSQGSFVPFSDGTPSILDYSYAGRRIMAGVNFRYGG